MLTKEYVDVGKSWKELPQNSGDRLLTERHQEKYPNTVCR